MNNRIRKLREQSINAVEHISSERALLLTEFLQGEEARGFSIPVERALAFRHIMLRKEIHVGEGELIVGERGPEPKATPTYPEVCLHSEEDLAILDSREKVAFRVDDTVISDYRQKIHPFLEREITQGADIQRTPGELEGCL